MEIGWDADNDGRPSAGVPGRVATGYPGGHPGAVVAGFTRFDLRGEDVAHPKMRPPASAPGSSFGNSAMRD